jgi:DNA repair exonuclease SbcCD ATPase subunit
MCEKNVIKGFVMRLSHLVFPAVFLIFAPLLPLVATAQDMDTIEGVYRQQYDQYTMQERELQRQMENLANLKSQVDNLIAQVGSAPTTNYAQEADRYRQLQLLLPSAIQYSQDLERRDKQLAEIQHRKDELKSQILNRQSTLPIWWTQ